MQASLHLRPDAEREIGRKPVRRRLCLRPALRDVPPGQREVRMQASLHLRPDAEREIGRKPVRRRLCLRPALRDVPPGQREDRMLDRR